jgi:hypothetical protein
MSQNKTRMSLWCFDISSKSIVTLILLMITVTDLLRVVSTRLIQTVCNKLLWACCHQLVNNLLQYVLTISDFLEQLVSILLASPLFLQDDNILLLQLRTCRQCGYNLLTNCWFFTRVAGLEPWIAWPSSMTVSLVILLLYSICQRWPLHAFLEEQFTTADIKSSSTSQV